MRWTSWQRRRSSSQSVKVGCTHPKGSRNPWPCWRQISTSRLFNAATSRCSRASRVLVHARATPPRRKSGTNESVSSAGDPAKRPAGDVNVDVGENPPGRGVGRHLPGGDGGGRPCAESASAAAVAIDPWRKRRRLPEIIEKGVAGNTEIGSGAGPEIFPRAGKMGGKADSAETQVNGLFCPRRCGGGHGGFLHGNLVHERIDHALGVRLVLCRKQKARGAHVPPSEPVRAKIRHGRRCSPGQMR
jgi:hypothetical protein